MKVVLDTNVLVSGIFFSGPPGEILKAWQAGRFQLLLSPAILLEYQRVGEELAARFQGVDISSVLGVLAT